MKSMPYVLARTLASSVQGRDQTGQRGLQLLLLQGLRQAKTGWSWSWKSPWAPGFSSMCRKISVIALSILCNFCHVLLPVRALYSPSLQVVCAVGLSEHWGCWSSLCCFLLYCSNLLSGCHGLSVFPSVCMCTREPFLK